MRCISNLALLVCAFSLTACATARIPNGKLNPNYTDYTEIPVETKLVELQVKNPLKVKVPVTNMQASGGGLVGALVVTAINVGANVASKEKRREKTEAIWESVNTDIYDPSGKIYLSTIKKADWIKVIGTEKYKNMELEEIKVAGEKTRAGLNGKTMGMFGSEYILGEYFENMTQKFFLTINPVKDGKAEKNIYKIILTSTYYPDDTMDTDLENYKLWIENDNARLKQAIEITTKEINEQLHSYLKYPYYIVEESKPDES